MLIESLLSSAAAAAAAATTATTMLSFLRFYLFIFRERKGGEREGGKHRCARIHL